MRDVRPEPNGGGFRICSTSANNIRTTSKFPGTKGGLEIIFFGDIINLYRNWIKKTTEMGGQRGGGENTMKRIGEWAFSGTTFYIQRKSLCFRCSPLLHIIWWPWHCGLQWPVASATPRGATMGKVKKKKSKVKLTVGRRD